MVVIRAQVIVVVGQSAVAVVRNEGYSGPVGRPSRVVLEMHVVGQPLTTATVDAHAGYLIAQVVSPAQPHVMVEGRVLTRGVHDSRAVGRDVSVVAVLTYWPRARAFWVRICDFPQRGAFGVHHPCCGPKVEYHSSVALGPIEEVRVPPPVITKGRAARVGRLLMRIRCPRFPR